jgi:hypothetical protein
MFAPIPQTKGQKRTGLGFLWDVGTNGGYVLSEPLQGYAPYTPPLHATQVAISAESAQAEHISGHLCRRCDATVTMSDGSSAQLEVWRAPDLNGFPCRITCQTNPEPFIVEFSRISLRPPAAGAFELPDGFTRFNSPEVMMSEIAVRQRTLRPKNPEESAAPERISSQPPRRNQ